MKTSLSNFAQNYKPAPENNSSNTPKTSYKNTNENIEEVIKQYQAMPQDELLRTLHAEVAKQKALGTFNLKKLQNTIDTLDAFLTCEQKQNIKELLNQL